MKQQNELFCTAKNIWMRMRLEARPIQFTNGHAHFYGKKNVDKFNKYFNYLINNYQLKYQMIYENSVLLCLK